ncbi:MAG: hypothetical protein ACYCSG_05495 [Thermoplasmataceae archaeon]
MENLRNGCKGVAIPLTSEEGDLPCDGIVNSRNLIKIKIKE